MCICVLASDPFQIRASHSSRGGLLKVDGATQLMIYKCSPLCTLGLWDSGQRFTRVDAVGTESHEIDSCQGVLSFCALVCRSLEAVEGRGV